MKAVLGADPGQQGGLVHIDGEGRLVEYRVMPKTPQEILAFFNTACVNANGEIIAVTESGGQLRGKYAAKSCGLYLGMLRMAACSCGIPLHEIPPTRWKSFFGVSAVKDTSIRMAKQLYPGINLRATPRCTTDSDGIAEALLISVYGRRKLL